MVRLSRHGGNIRRRALLGITMSQGPKNPAMPAARVRGDIQKGRTGDKVPGFDPAAAPLETDAEAAGAPSAEAAGPVGSADAEAPHANSSSHGAAMRRFETERRSGSFSFLSVLAGIGLALVLIALAVLAW